MVDEFVETSQPDNMPAKNGTRTCNDCSEIPCSNQAQSSGLESLHLPDWVTSFPGYFEDCGIVAGHATVDHIDSPVHEYLPRKDVPIGPEHQADIPEWRPRVSKIVPSASSSCADVSYGSISNSQFAPRDDDSENEKWVRHCVVPISTSRFDGIGGNNVDCECSDEGSVRCVRKHIFEARESLKMSLGPDKFRDLGLYEMGEDVAQEWTDEEENRFQGKFLLIVYHWERTFGITFRMPFQVKVAKSLLVIILMSSCSGREHSRTDQIYCVWIVMMMNCLMSLQ